MRIHFVYAFHPNSAAIHSPYCITRNLYNYLKTRAEVIYHEWSQRGVIDVKPDDVFIGHPHYDKGTVVQRTIREKHCRVMCTIHPLHTALPQHNMPFDELARKVDRIFSICGPYWTDTIQNTPFAHWAPKITRLDMAVDPKQFPFLKNKFNPPGKRRLVYIGSSMPMKNLGYMAVIMQGLPNVQLHWYGGSSDHRLAKLPNVKTTGWIQLNKKTAQKIVDECDIFINTSNSDANPTTLLESMAWGLINACTKESGYWHDPLFTELYLDDIGKTRQAIRELIVAPEQQLAERSKQGRKEIETKYTWDRFGNTIWTELQRLYALKS